MEPSAPQQLLATWNAASSAWETTETTLCGHSVVFSETWPTSGMTRRGKAYALPTSAPLMDGSASSSLPGLPAPRTGTAQETLLPTPMTSDTNGGGCTGQEGLTSGPSSPLFRTPTAQLAINGGSQHPDKRKAGGHGPTLADEVEHLLI